MGQVQVFMTSGSTQSMARLHVINVCTTRADAELNGDTYTCRTRAFDDTQGAANGRRGEGCVVLLQCIVSIACQTWLARHVYTMQAGRHACDCTASYVPCRTLLC